MTQRKYPSMVNISANVVAPPNKKTDPYYSDLDDYFLELSLPDGKSLKVAASPNGAKFHTKLWGDIVYGIDQGDEASIFLGTYLSRECKLIMKDVSKIRSLPVEHTPSISNFSYLPQTGNILLT